MRLPAGEVIADEKGRASLGFATKWQRLVAPHAAAIEQITSRTTVVTANGLAGHITLVSAAGSASWRTFTVTNSEVATDDVIVLSQKSGTDLYMCHVTDVSGGSFDITSATTGGTTTEQPVIAFRVLKQVAP